MQKLAKERDYMNPVLDTADRIVHMEDGRLVQQPTLTGEIIHCTKNHHVELAS